MPMAKLIAVSVSESSQASSNRRIPEAAESCIRCRSTSSSATRSACGGGVSRTCIIATVTGEGVFGRLKFESGVHRVQRVPTTESQGRIHTSAATVAVLPEVEDVEIEIHDKDIRIDTYRSSGAGGRCAL